MIDLKEKSNEISSWDDLEFFNNPTSRGVNPYVTITKLGAIIFNANFCRTNDKKINNKTYVKVGWSQSNFSIVIKLLEDNEIKREFSVFKINRPSGTDAINFSCRTFFKKNFLSTHDTNGRYEAVFEKISSDDFIIIRL